MEAAKTQLTRQVVRLEYCIDSMYKILCARSAHVMYRNMLAYSEDNICLVERPSQQVHHIVAVFWERPREQLRQEDPQSLYLNQSETGLQHAELIRIHR